MKFKNQDGSIVTSVGATAQGDVTINQKEIQKLIYIVTSGLYSDPIGSIVREYTSNCFDAHRAANNTTDPVVVRLTPKFIQFIDKGIGLSTDDFVKIFCSILTSESSKTDDALGMWGLGSKSAFSFVNQFKVTSTVDGETNSWMLIKTANNKITWESISSEQTGEPNGTTVTIATKGETDKFVSAIRKQLRYFDNVYVDMQVQGYGFPNDYTLYENEHFLINNTNTPTTLEICFGKVNYPINWDALGMDSIAAPMALRFEIGELEVTPSREGISWTPKYVQKVKDKIDEVRKFLIEKIDEQPTVEIGDIIEYTNRLHQPNYLTIGDVKVNPRSFGLKNRVAYKYKFRKELLNLEEELCRESHTGSGKTDDEIEEIVEKRLENADKPSNYIHLFDKHLVRTWYRLEGWRGKRVKEQKNGYGSSILANIRTNYERFRFMTRKQSKKIHYLYDNNVVDSNTAFITVNTEKMSAEMLKALIARRGILIDNVDLPKTYSYGSNKAPVGDDEIVGAWGETGGRNPYHCTYKKINQRVDEFEDIDETVFYGTNDEREMLEPLCCAGFKTFMCAVSHHKYFDDLDNYINVNDYMDAKELQENAQTFMNVKELNRIENVLGMMREFTDKIMDSDTRVRLYDIMKDFKLSVAPQVGYSSEKLVADMYEAIAETLKITPEQEVVDVADKYEFLNFVDLFTAHNRANSKMGLRYNTGEGATFQSTDRTRTVEFLEHYVELYNKCK